MFLGDILCVHSCIFHQMIRNHCRRLLIQKETMQLRQMYVSCEHPVLNV